MTTGPIHYLSDVPRRDKTNRKTVCKGLAKYNVKIPKTSNLIRTQHSNSFSKVLRLFLRSQSQKPWLWIAPRPNSPTSLTGLARPVRRKNRSPIRRTRTFPTATGSKTLRFPFHYIIIIFIVFSQIFKPIKYIIIYVCLCVYVGICF